MPRVTPLTAELRDADDRRRQIVRNAKILKAACTISPFGSMTAVAKELQIPPSTFTQSVKLGTIRSVDMAQLCKLLDLDADTRAALNGSRKRCMYD